MLTITKPTKCSQNLHFEMINCKRRRYILKHELCDRMIKSSENEEKDKKKYTEFGGVGAIRA